jgi:hypothetical protein
MKLREDECELLAAEAQAALERLPAGPARAGYEQLLAETGAGELKEESLPFLERLLEVGLEAGRIRATHGAHAEMAANRLFLRSGRGAALRDSLAGANQALAALAGAEIEQIAFELRGPGAYTLSVATSQCRATVVIDRNGVRVHSLEVG